MGQKERQVAKKLNLKPEMGVEKKLEAKLNKKDYKYMLIIILVYSILSFVNLGSFEAPQTFWTAQKDGEGAVLELESPAQLGCIKYYRGNDDGAGILACSESVISKEGGTDASAEQSGIAASAEESSCVIEDITGSDVFTWQQTELNQNCRSIIFSASEEGFSIGEVAAYDINGNQIKLKAINTQAEKLLDERNTVPEMITPQNSAYFDETYFARAAYEIIHDMPVFEASHPHLGKLIMTIPIKAMGMVPFAYRLMGNIAGILMLAVMYAFTKNITGKSRYAVIATVIFAFEGMHFVQTRIATVDSFLVLFIMFAYWMMYRYTLEDNQNRLSRKLTYLLLSGMFMGMAMATKWTGCYCAVGLAILFFLDFYNRYRGDEGSAFMRQQGFKIIASCAGFFIILPVAIYVLCYLPVISGGSLGETLKLIANQQRVMFEYHSGVTGDHPYASKWYQWPFGYKNMWYCEGVQTGDRQTDIFLIANPFIWWPGLLCMLYTVWNAAKKGAMVWRMLCIIILTAFLPYALISREMFLYHYFPVVPFMIIAMALCLQRLEEKGRSAKAVYIYMAVLFVSTAALYPLYAGLNVSEVWINQMVVLLRLGFFGI